MEPHDLTAREWEEYIRFRMDEEEQREAIRQEDQQ